MHNKKTRTTTKIIHIKVIFSDRKTAIHVCRLQCCNCPISPGEGMMTRVLGSRMELLVQVASCCNGDWSCAVPKAAYALHLGGSHILSRGGATQTSGNCIYESVINSIMLTCIQQTTTVVIWQLLSAIICCVTKNTGLLRLIWHNFTNLQRSLIIFGTERVYWILN